MNMDAAQYGAVALLGLGAMGLPMALTLRRAGFQVTVFDVRSGPVQAAVAQGATAAASTADALRGARAAIVMTQNIAQAREALLSTKGGSAPLDGLAPGGLVLLTSTVAPADARALAGECAARGFLFVDAPVSGGPEGAETGGLTIMVGGAPDARAAAMPLLDALGAPDRVFVVGDEPGSGEAMKMINQLMAGVNIVATCEAMALAVKAGLDPRQAFTIVSDAAGGSWMFRNRAPRMLDGDFVPPHSVLNIFVKDLGIVNDTANSLGLPLPVAGAARQAVLMGVAAGLGGEDDAGLVRFYEQLAGVSVSAAAKQ